MFRKLLIMLSLFAVNTVYAGSYENALQKNGNVFLYFYVKNCKTCKVFDKTYDNLKMNNKDYEFVKVDVETPYGSRLVNKFKVKYVPFIILTDSKSNKNVSVNHTCVMDEVCLMRAMKSFKGHG